MSLIQDYKNTYRILKLYEAKRNPDFGEIRNIEYDLKHLIENMCDGFPAGQCRTCCKKNVFKITNTYSYIFCQECNDSSYLFTFSRTSLPL